MAKSYSVNHIITAVGGAAFSLIAAQVLPITMQNAHAEEGATTEQPSVQQAPRVTLGERAQGEITSASEINGKDGSRFTRFAIDLDADELVELSLDGALQGVIAVYDDQMQLLDSGEPLRFRTGKEGSYNVIVSGVDAHSYGPFYLESREIDLTESDTLSVGETVDGWLQGSEQTVSLSIEEAGLYQIDLRSDDFDAYLTLEGPNGYRREDDDGGGELNAQVSDFLEPGDYTLRASSYGDSDGVFTLSAETRQLPGDGELKNDGPIAPGESLNGWFSNEELSYELEVDEAGIYQIDMMSSDIDSYLEISGPDNYFQENDDGGNGLDSSISDFLAPGTYQVTARSAYGDDSGLFTLNVESRELPEGVELRNDGALTPGESLTGWYSGEPLSYELTLDESSTVTLAMDSDDFDAYLELSGEGVSYTDDDGGRNTNARLQESLLPGTYTVEASGFSASGSGMFDLELTTEKTEMAPDA